MNTAAALRLATACLERHIGYIFDVFSIAEPTSVTLPLLAKTISKFSPLVGNLIEASVVDVLNQERRFQRLGQWERQDPEFPDALFVGNIKPAPGVEIKAWLPLSTEITARFRESQARLRSHQTNIALLAWLPENIIYGRPKLIDVCIVPGLSVARSRDQHYHNPPDYLVLEHEDTTSRTRNLQQTNTYGFKWQGTSRQFHNAERVVRSWGKSGKRYDHGKVYQQKLRALMGRYPYRLDTNYAKMDRIQNREIEIFKERVLNKDISGMTLHEWVELLRKEDSNLIKQALKKSRQ